MPLVVRPKSSSPRVKAMNSVSGHWIACATASASRLPLPRLLVTAVMMRLRA